MLSGYAYFPPVETVITPRTEMAALASLAPQRRRRPYSRLRPHVGVVYPPPVTFPPVETTVQTGLVAVGSSLDQQRRRPFSRLLPARYIDYPVVGPADAVEQTVLVAARDSSLSTRRRQTMGNVRPPQFVGAPVVVPPAETVVATNFTVAVGMALAGGRRRTIWVPVRPIVVFQGGALGWTAVMLAPRPRAQTMSVLLPPVVVTPEAPPFIEDHLMVKLVINRRGR